MKNKAEVLEKMKSRHYYRDYRRSHNSMENNLCDEGVYQEVLCVDALYDDYQYLKRDNNLSQMWGNN